MFQKYPYYCRCGVNTLISRAFSCWHNSATTFAGEFLQIQQTKNNCRLHCIIPFKHQQFCQRKQFCSGNDGIHPLPVLEILDSSADIPSPETQTNYEMEQNEPNYEMEQNEEKFLEETEQQMLDHENLETRMLELENKMQLQLKLNKGKSGRKFFLIRLNKHFHWADFRKILVPEDGYAFLRALDQLIGELAAEDFEQKLQIQDSLSTKMHLSKLKTVQVTGQNHKFRLELLLFFRNTNKKKMEKEICLRLCAMNKIILYEGRMILPLEALPWLREQMAELLAKYDGTEQIEMEAPAQISQKFFHMNKLCQHYQFYETETGNDSSNSSFFSNSLSKMPTNSTMEQKPSNEIQKTEVIPDDDIFADYIRMKKSDGTFLKLKLEKDKIGQRFIEIQENSDDNSTIIRNFGNILFPEDAYAFVRAMDELIMELASKNFDQKLLQGKHQSKHLLKLRTLEIIGKMHKFQLELLFFPNVGRADIKQELCILLLAFKLPIEDKSNPNSRMLLPLRALPWLRKQMVEMLAKHDGTKAIAKEAPAKIPKKHLMK